MGKFEKVIAGFVGFATAVTMSFGTASAATTADLQAQIASLSATIAALQAQLNNSTTTSTTGAVSGYTFAKDLTVGSRGTDVTNLQNVVGISPATGYFGALTKAAVIKFQTAHAITPAVGYVGAKTRAALNGGTTTTTTTTTTTQGTGTGLTAALSYDSPASGTIIAGQAVADLAHFTFSNPTGVAQTVTKVTLNRTGVSNDSTFDNVYLFNGAKRLTDSATVSNTVITFNDASGLFTIPAGGMITVSVKADIHANSNGQIIGVSLASVTGSVAVNGAFPILGNNQSIATATMATVDFGSSVTPSTASIDPQTGYVLWQNTLQVGTRDVSFNAMTFQQIGSVGTADVGNFTLLVDGAQVGAAVPSLDANGYITFDLTAAPKTLIAGSHVIKLMGDIIGGSTKNFSFSIQNAGDSVFVDSQVGQPILPTVSSASFSARTSGTETVNGGTLTITKDTTSPSGNITKTASNVLLGKFTIKAAGEPMKIQDLNVNATVTTSGTITLRNGTIFANGVQVGNSASMKTNGSYTDFTFGSSLVVMPGTPVTLEVHADVYNDANSTTIASGDSITANIGVGSNNVKLMNSLTYQSYPGSSIVSANTLTVATGSLSGAKNSAYANQTVIVPQTAYKLGSFTITSNETEKITLDTISLSFGGSVVPSTDLNNVYVVYGGKTSSVKSTVSATPSWSISQTMDPNTTMTVDVYGDLTTSLTGSDTINVALTMSGTTADSASAVSATTGTGQTITVGTGSVAAEAVSDSSLTTKMVVGNTSPKIASFRFTAVNDTYKITDLALKAVGGDAGAGAIRTLTLKSQGMADKDVYLGTGYEATTTGLSINVPANDSAGTVVDVYANLNDVGGYAAASGANVSITLDTYKAINSVGTVVTAPTDITTNAQYVFKSIPTITLQALPSTLLQTGTKTLSKFTVSADSAGAIGWRKMVWQISKSNLTNVDVAGLSLVDSGNNVIDGAFATTSSPIAGGTTLWQAADTSGTLYFIATNELQITTSETYSLKGNVSGNVGGTDKSLSTSIANPNLTSTAPTAYATIAATDASFVWTDRSANSHTASTSDWNDDYKVKNLPTDTQTLTGQ